MAFAGANKAASQQQKNRSAWQPSYWPASCRRRVSWQDNERDLKIPRCKNNFPILNRLIKECLCGPSRDDVVEASLDCTQKGNSRNISMEHIRVFSDDHYLHRQNGCKDDNNKKTKPCHKHSNHQDFFEKEISSNLGRRRVLLKLNIIDFITIIVFRNTI